MERASSVDETLSQILSLETENDWAKRVIKGLTSYVPFNDRLSPDELDVKKKTRYGNFEALSIGEVIKYTEKEESGYTHLVDIEESDRQIGTMKMPYGLGSNEPHTHTLWCVLTHRINLRIPVDTLGSLLYGAPSLESDLRRALTGERSGIVRVLEGLIDGIAMKKGGKFLCAWSGLDIADLMSDIDLKRRPRATESRCDDLVISFPIPFYSVKCWGTAHQCTLSLQWHERVRRSIEARGFSLETPCYTLSTRVNLLKNSNSISEPLIHSFDKKTYEAKIHDVPSTVTVGNKTYQSAVFAFTMDRRLSYKEWTIRVPLDIERLVDIAISRRIPNAGMGTSDTEVARVLQDTALRRLTDQSVGVGLQGPYIYLDGHPHPFEVYLLLQFPSSCSVPFAIRVHTLSGFREPY